MRTIKNDEGIIMKNPLELAEEHLIKTVGFVSKQDRNNFLAGYQAAVSIVEAELKLIEELRATQPGLGGICCAIKSILSKLS